MSTSGDSDTSVSLDDLFVELLKEHKNKNTCFDDTCGTLPSSYRPLHVPFRKNFYNKIQTIVFSRDIVQTFSVSEKMKRVGYCHDFF